MVYCTIVYPGFGIACEGQNRKDINVLSVLLQPKLSNDDWHLGAMIFDNIFKPIVAEQQFPICDSVYEDLIGRASNGSGITTERSGGSNGPVDISDPVFHAWMGKAGKCPKASFDAIYIAINNEDISCVKVYYFTPYDPKKDNKGKDLSECKKTPTKHLE